MRRTELLCQPAPFQLWEDYRAGLYARLPHTEQAVRASYALLTAPDRFLAAARAMVQGWPVTSCTHLADRGRGRRAWIGQATCCHHHGANQAATTEAWGRMSQTAHQHANQAALMLLIDWEDAHTTGGLLASRGAWCRSAT
jgi:hypothetical protein